MGNYVGTKITFNQEHEIEMRIHEYLTGQTNSSRYVKKLVGMEMVKKGLLSYDEVKSLYPEKRKRAKLAEQTVIEYIDKLKILESQSGKCRLCNCSITTHDKDLGTHWHLDHVYPVSKGGVHAYFNSQILCSICNLDKSDNLYEVPPKHKDLCESNKLLHTISSKDYIFNFLKQNNLDGESLYGE
jgi:5-methylcytosine-specific restriction endonuclease McrA